MKMILSGISIKLAQIFSIAVFSKNSTSVIFSPLLPILIQLYHSRGSGAIVVETKFSKIKTTHQ
jgi:hypothetical protein